MVMKKKTRLTKLKINEVSGVDNPACPNADVVFWKRDSETNGDSHMTPEELAKKLETMEVEKAELEILAKMSDAEKEFLAKMDGDKKKEFMALDADKRKDAMKKSADEAAEKEAAEKADKETKEVEKNMSDKTETVSKADFEAVQKANEDIRKANAEMAEKIAKMESDKAYDDFIAKAAKQVPGLASEAKADLAKSLFAMGEAERDAVIKELASAEKVKNDYMIEKGTAARGEDSAEGQLEVLTKNYMETNKASYSDALEAVTKTAEGKALYNKTLAGAN